MAKFKILLDSTSDFPKEQMESWDVDIVPLYLIWSDGTSEKDDTRDFEELKKFYEKLKNAMELPKSSQPTVEDWKAKYEEVKQQGYDGILVITISSNMSGTFNSASLAAQEVDIPVKVIDSRQASTAISPMARFARELFNQGADLETTAQELQKAMAEKRFGAFFYVSDFSFLVKGGRVSKFTGFVGSMLKIRVAIYINDEGEMVPFGKARGFKAALDEVLKKSEEQGFKPGDTVDIYLVSCDNMEELKEIEKVVKGIYNVKNVYYTPTGKVISTHVGPGQAGYGIERY
ncbi:MAG TPA: DegV family protein [Fervidobacterium sp.]|nr:DegV family protein [Fervidobacterium sp.]HOM74385.1 DegV family protein [Fervidobacterium sp.]HOQ40038.1 DegV family protein [Fervidobacterium sp.]HPT53411.1 DegV family protein [Fervidobacterium sp.]HPZ17851.1 DegV family protein [Fervidobacterium sp.]